MKIIPLLFTLHDMSTIMNVIWRKITHPATYGWGLGRPKTVTVYECLWQKVRQAMVLRFRYNLQNIYLSASKEFGRGENSVGSVVESGMLCVDDSNAKIYSSFVCRTMCSNTADSESSIKRASNSGATFIMTTHTRFEFWSVQILCCVLCARVKWIEMWN